MGDIKPVRLFHSWRVDKKAKDHIRAHADYVQVQSTPSITQPHAWRDLKELLGSIIKLTLDPANRHYNKECKWFLDEKNDYREDVGRFVVGLPNDGLPLYKRAGPKGKDAYLMHLQFLNMRGASNLPDQTHMFAGILDTEDGKGTEQLLTKIMMQIDDVRDNGLTIEINGTQRKFRFDFIPKADLSMVAKIFKQNLSNGNHIHPYMYVGGKSDQRQCDMTIGKEGSGADFTKVTYDTAMRHWENNSMFREEYAQGYYNAKRKYHDEVAFDTADKKVTEKVKEYARHAGEGDSEESNYQIHGPPSPLAKYPIFFCDMHAAANEGMNMLERVWQLAIHLTEDPKRATLFGAGDEAHKHKDAPTQKFIQGKSKYVL